MGRKGRRASGLRCGGRVRNSSSLSDDWGWVTGTQLIPICASGWGGCGGAWGIANFPVEMDSVP